MDVKRKYHKYKHKYLKLKRQIAEESGTNIRILLKNAAGGLLLDAQLIASLVPNSYIVTVSEASDNEINKVTCANIHLEHVFSIDNKFPAKKNYFFVNHELITDWDLEQMQKADIIPLCKTKIGCETLKKLDLKPVYTKFSTPQFDKNIDITKKDPNLFIHFAGFSPFKNTDLVIKTWLENDGFVKINPNIKLIVTRSNKILPFTSDEKRVFENIKFEPNVELELDSSGQKIIITNLKKYKNIYFYTERLDDILFKKLTMLAQYHITPSMIEGYGHIINQSRMVGGICLTTDAEPMNELITKDYGFLIKIHHTFQFSEKQMKIRLWLPNDPRYKLIANRIDTRNLAKQIYQALSLSDEQKINMGKLAQSAYFNDTNFFINKLRTIFS